MRTIKDLGCDDLLFILNCQNLKELNDRFANQLKVDTSQYTKMKYPNNKISQSIQDVLLSGPTSWLYAAMWVVSLASVPLLPASIITSALGGLFLVTGGMNFYSSYRNIKKDQEYVNDYLELINIKRECSDQLLMKEHKKIDKIRKTPEHKVVLDIFDIKLQPDPDKRDRLTEAKKFVSTTSLISALLFGTYYLAAPTFLSVLGFGAAAVSLTGPIGLGIFFGVSLGAGLYFGYKEYKENKQAQAYAQEKIIINREFELRKERYVQLARKKIELKAERRKAEAQKQMKLENSENPAPTLPVGTPTQANQSQFATNPMILLNQPKQESPAQTAAVNQEPALGFKGRSNVMNGS